MTQVENALVQMVNGDLLKSDCNIMIHQANCFNVMGAGIAKQIKKLFPGAFEADKNFPIPVGSEERLGCFSHYYNGHVTIVNLYGQYKYGRRAVQTSYAGLERGLDSIIAHLASHRASGYTYKVGVPYNMGCGNAGGSWDIVLGIISKIANKYQYPIYIYKFR